MVASTGQKSLFTPKRLVIGTLIVAGAIGGFLLLRGVSTNSQSQPTENVIPIVKTVTALGF